MTNWKNRSTRRAVAALCLSLAPALTGCLTHTYSVPKTRPADVILDANLEQLIGQVNSRFDDIKTINASVEIEATTGGSRKGAATDFPAFSGYIFLRKPQDVRVILRVPLLGSQALDMVSDGKTWKLWIPSKKLAREGTNLVSAPSKNSLENLRPAVFFDSLLVRGVSPSEVVSLTSDVRILENPKKKKDLVEESDYDIEVLTPPNGQIAHTLRVIHISRANLLPYQQDIYDESGQIVTRAFYTDYQRFGFVLFPTHIIIRRPIDQLSLSVIINKLTLNQPLENDQFELNIPAGVPMQKMP
jgi:outer membrane lipoprotein-sorting protein